MNISGLSSVIVRVCKKVVGIRGVRVCVVILIFWCWLVGVVGFWVGVGVVCSC